MMQAGHLLVMSRVVTAFGGVKFPVTQFRKPMIGITGPYATSTGPPCIISYHLCSQNQQNKTPWAVPFRELAVQSARHIIGNINFDQFLKPELCWYFN